MLCLLVAGTSTVKAQNAKIILHHNGTPTFFSSNETQAALDASADGDTLYFSEGNYSGGITISKKVVMIGYGDEKSVISGNVSVAIGAGGETLTKTLMEGLRVYDGTITIDKSIKGLIIRKCTFPTIQFKADVEEARIDRCRVLNTSYGIRLSNYVKGLVVNNSKIRYIEGDAPAAESAIFTNCNIRRESLNNTATYMNCILSGLGSSQVATNTYINCLVRDGNNYISSAESHDCWKYDTNPVDDNMDCVLTDEQLLSVGYVGTDGKVIGINGGETPYSLTTTAPKITEFSSAVDAETLKVTVNLKVSNK